MDPYLLRITFLEGVLIFLIINSSLVAADDGIFTSDEFVFFSGLSVPLELQSAEERRIWTGEDSPFPRGWFGVANVNETESLRRFGRGIIRIDLSDHAANSELVDALDAWAKGDKTERLWALSKIRYFQSVAVSQMGTEFLRLLELRMLYVLEEYQQLRLIAQNYIDSAPTETFKWHMQWVIADSYYKQHLPEQATSAYSSLTAELLPRKLELSDEWKLNLIEIGLLNATTKMLRAYNRKSMSEIQQLVVGLSKHSRESILEFDQKLLGRIYNLIGLCHGLLGDDRAAVRNFEASIKAHGRTILSSETSKPHNNLVDVFRRKGDFGRAMHNASKAYELEMKIGNSSHLGQIRLNMAELYNEVGRLGDAKRFSEDALSIFNGVDNYEGVINSYYQMGLAQLHDGASSDVGEAAVSFENGLNWLEKLDGVYNNQSTKLRLAIGLARSELFAGNFKRAKEAYQKIEDYSGSKEITTGKSGFSDIELDRFLLQVQFEFYFGSKDSFTNLARELSSEIDELSSAQSRSGSSELNGFLGIQLELQKLFLEAARREDSIQQILGVLRNLKGLKSRGLQVLDPAYLGPSWSEKIFQVQSLGVDYIFKHRDEFKVHQIANLLLEHESSLNHQIRRRDSMKLSSSALDGTQKAIQDSGLSVRQESKRAIVSENRIQQVDALKDTSDQILAFSSAYSAAFTGSSNVSSKPISVLEFQNRLEPNEAILLFHMGRLHSFSIQISRTNMQLFEIESRDKILKLKSQLTKSLIERSRTFPDLSTAMVSALGLGKLRQQAIRRLLINSGGLLDDLPFLSLDLSFRGDSYLPLGSLVEVVITPSVTEYLMPRRINEAAFDLDGDIVVFADPEFGQYSKKKIAQSDPFGLRSWSAGLRRLPWSAHEASSIEQVYGSKSVKIYTGRQATSENLMSPESRHAKVLHIASHGYFHIDLPDIVGIATASEQHQSRNDFDLVSLPDILAKDFYSNLVVVSGCDTANGSYYSGEGFNSLSRGLILSGAKSVLGSIWKIPDKPTAEMMRAFHTKLRDTNGNVSLSLLLSIKDLLRSGRYRHPFYWAGFNYFSIDGSASRNVFQ